MSKQHFRFLFLCVLMFAFGTMVFAQKTKQPRKTKVYRSIMSGDFSSNEVKSKPVKKVKKRVKRCRYYYYKRKNKTYRVYRCRKR